MDEHSPKRSDFIHHQQSKISESLREIVFGAEDGMVSTLGALTGIAAGTQNQFAVIVAGFVIIFVESTAMSVGSFLSSKSVREMDERKLKEEEMEIEHYPQGEQKELAKLYTSDGWPTQLANQMAAAAANDKSLMLKEMAYRELGIIPNKAEQPFADAAFMFIFYMIGGSIPLLPYVLLPISQALVVSIIITLIGLFGLGAATTKFTKRNVVRAGAEVLILGSVAAAIGYVVGQIANAIIS